MFGQRRSRSDCMDAQSDQGLRCPQTESLDTIEFCNVQEMPGWDYACARWCLNLHILRIFKGTFFYWRGPDNLRHTQRRAARLLNHWMLPILVYRCTTENSTKAISEKQPLLSKRQFFLNSQFAVLRRLAPVLKTFFFILFIYFFFNHASWCKSKI